MIKFLNDKLDKLGATKFRYSAPLISLISDLTLLYYIKKLVVRDFANIQTVNMALKMQQIDPMIVNTQDKQAIINMLLTSLNLGLTIIITINLTVYAFCLKNTPWAKNYLKGYAFTGAVLSVFEIIVYYTKLSTVNSITVITMLMYFIVYYGYRHFMRKEEL